MLLKWISCTVPDRDAFAAAQRGWGALSDLPGFLGQAGGWSRHTPGLAQIFGCWRDHAAYQAFMSGPHDRIAAGQAGTYGTIQVRLFDALPIAGRAPGFAGASLLRLDFVRAQPAPPASPGFAGGVLARRAPGDYLVLTAWRSTADHDDLTAIDGDRITIDPTWTVRPLRSGSPGDSGFVRPGRRPR